MLKKKGNSTSQSQQKQQQQPNADAILPALPSTESEPIVKSVGASISSSSVKAQQAVLIKPIDLEESQESLHASRASEVITKRIERNPNSRREAQSKPDDAAAGGIQRVERRVSNFRHAAVSVVPVADVLTEVRTASKVRFDLAPPANAANVKDAAAASKPVGDAAPAGILRKQNAGKLPPSSNHELQNMADTPHVASKDPGPDSSPIPTSKPGTKKTSAKSNTKEKNPVAEIAASDIQESPPQPSRIPRRSLTEPPKESSTLTEAVPAPPPKPAILDSKSKDKPSKKPSSAAAVGASKAKAEEKPPPPPEKSTSVAVTTPATTSTTETLHQPQPQQKKESQISLVKEHSSSSLVSISKKKLIAIDKPSPASDSKKGVGGGSSGGTDKSVNKKQPSQRISDSDGSTTGNDNTSKSTSSSTKETPVEPTSPTKATENKAKAAGSGPTPKKGAAALKSTNPPKPETLSTNLPGKLKTDTGNEEVNAVPQKSNPVETSVAKTEKAGKSKEDSPNPPVKALKNEAQSKSAVAAAKTSSKLVTKEDVKDSRLDSKADLVSKSKRSQSVPPPTSSQQTALNTAKNGEIAAEITKETKQKPSEKSKPVPTIQQQKGIEPKPKPGPTTESKTSKATKEPILASSPAAAAVGQKRQKSASEPPVQKPGKLSKLSPSDGKVASIDEVRLSKQNLAAPPPVKLAKSSTISKSALAASNSTLADSSRSSIVKSLEQDTQLKNASKISSSQERINNGSQDTLSKSKASLNDSDDKPMEKAKSRSKADLAAASKASKSRSTSEKPSTELKPKTAEMQQREKQRTSEPSPDTVVDGSNSRLQRNLRLRAKLKLDVDGCFAMGLCAPVEEDLSPPTNLPEELDESKHSSETSLIELEQVPKVIPGIPCPLPLKRHPSARRTVMKTIGYPATGWTPIDSKDPETVEEVKQYRFRRAKSLEDASVMYSAYRETHPLPFGHHGTYNEFKALRGDGDEPQNLEEQKSYEDAMMESFGFTAPFTEEMAKAQAETLKRPTTVQAGDSKPTPRPVTNNKQTTSNSIRAKPQSAQEMHIASAPPAILPPLAKPPASLGSQVQPNISENSVKYLQQYMDRAKKAGREPPAIPVSKPQQQQQQQHKIETASQAHRKAPITAIVPSENVGILPSSRIRELSATKVDTERYSSIVQKRSGWEPGVPYADAEETRGRSLSRRREETGLFQNDERTSKSLDRGFVTRTLPTRESTRPATQIGFGDVDPFGFDIETPRLGSPIARSIIAGQKASGKPRVLKVKPKTSPVMPRKSKMGVGKMKGKPLKRIELESEPVDTNPAVARASENNSWFYPGGSEMTTSGIYQQPGMYPMNVGGPNDFQHLNSQYNPLQLHQQVMQTHFPWMYNFNCYPQAPAPKLPVQANVSFENDNKVEPPLKPKKGGAKAQPKSSLKKSKAPSRQSTPKNQQKQQSPVISTGNMSHALPQDRQPFAALPNYNMIQNMPLRHMIPPPPSQQQQHSSSHPQNLQHNQPFVPPTLMPARIRLQNVPVVTLQQAMVIEATGEPPGSVGAFPGHSEMMMQPTYINNGPFGGMGMYAGGMMNRGDWQEQGRNALNQATEHVEEIHSKEIVEPKKKTVKLSEKPKSRSGVRAMIQKGLIGRHRGGI